MFCFNHRETPTESSPENLVKIRLYLAEILRIRKLDWCDGGGGKGRRRGGILLCNGLIIKLINLAAKETHSCGKKYL